MYVLSVFCSFLAVHQFSSSSNMKGNYINFDCFE